MSDFVSEHSEEEVCGYALVRVVLFVCLEANRLSQKMDFILQGKRHKACEEASDVLWIMWTSAKAA